MPVVYRRHQVAATLDPAEEGVLEIDESVAEGLEGIELRSELVEGKIGIEVLSTEEGMPAEDKGSVREIEGPRFYGWRGQSR
jgi:hypothetical protein